MRESGELVEWDDDRGFGFVRADAGGDRLFVHVKSIRRIATRPRAGDRLTFARGVGRDSRPAAINAEIAGANPLPPPTRPGLPPEVASGNPRAAWRLGAAGLLLAILLCATLAARVPGWLVIAYLGAGVVSIAAYWLDKRAAEAGQWRISEATLHGIDFAGGIIGGLAAQALLRHKTSKPDFGLVTGRVVLIHIFGLAALIAGVFEVP